MIGPGNRSVSPGGTIRFDVLDTRDPSTDPKARVTYTAHWRDAIGRQIATAAYGTNGGTALVRPDTIPDRSDTVLVTTIGYNDAGEAFQTIDPAGARTGSSSTPRREPTADTGRRTNRLAADLRES